MAPHYSGCRVPQVAEKLPNAPAVLVTAGDEGAAYCCRSAKGEHTGRCRHTPVLSSPSVVCWASIMPQAVTCLVHCRRSCTTFFPAAHVACLALPVAAASLAIGGQDAVDISAVQKQGSIDRPKQLCSAPAALLHCTALAGFVPVFKLDVVDTTGAGDAFTAGFLYKVSP